MTDHSTSRSATAAPRPIFRRLWDGWVVVATKIGHVQSRVILTILYFTILLPFVLLVRLSPDSRRERHHTASNWVPFEPNDDPDNARMQF